jgi:hypothetical protein
LTGEHEEEDDGKGRGKNWGPDCHRKFPVAVSPENYIFAVDFLVDFGALVGLALVDFGALVDLS